MQPDNTDPSLIEYPLDFPVKIMGRNQPGFVHTVVSIVRRHAPDYDASGVELRPSKKNAYLSVTCVIRAVSREQLDALYRELNDHPDVVMVL
jgi:putative lipoic acid-binding regulatory protein